MAGPDLAVPVPRFDMAGMPIKPYTFINKPIEADSIMSTSKRPRAREQGISFNGAARDSDHAKWYVDSPPINPITPISAPIHLALSAAPALSPSSAVQERANCASATKRRKLERFTSAEAMDAFMKEDHT